MSSNEQHGETIAAEPVPAPDDVRCRGLAVAVQRREKATPRQIIIRSVYAQGLGLTLKRRLSSTWVELEATNLSIFLLTDRPPVADLGSTTADRNYQRHWIPVHLDFIVGDLDREVGR